MNSIRYYLLFFNQLRSVFWPFLARLNKQRERRERQRERDIFWKMPGGWLENRTNLREENEGWEMYRYPRAWVVT